MLLCDRHWNKVLQTNPSLEDGFCEAATQERDSVPGPTAFWVRNLGLPQRNELLWARAQDATYYTRAVLTGCFG
jgi:hypothetical protein